VKIMEHPIAALEEFLKPLSMKRLLIILPLVIFCQCNSVDDRSKLKYLDQELSNEVRVNDLLSRLSIEEKISLLITTSEGVPHLGIDKYYHGNEALHGIVRPGRATVFPQAIALAATWNPELVKDVATVISDEARAKWNFYNQGKNQTSLYSDVLTFWSPTVNMARDPRWGRTPETYGEDPFLTGKTGVAFVKGLQGDDDKYLKVVSTPKHFAANNEDYNRFYCNAIIPERALHEYYLMGFKRTITEGKAQAIMSAYNAINGIPCSANKWLLEDVLRESWGFDGYVVGDCGAINHLFTSHEYVNSKEEAAKVAIEAGLDLECGDDVYKNSLLVAYKNGIVEEKYINQATRRMLMMRFRLGLFDPPKDNPYAEISPDVIGSKKHQDIALQTARESIVLLKNAKNTLPLNPDKSNKIAVLGPNAAKIIFGDYSGKPVIKPVSILDGIIEAAGEKAEVTHVKWRSTLQNMVAIEPEYYSNDSSEQNGLFAEYYNNQNLNGKPNTRIDAWINYDSESQPPDPVIFDAPMSIRWRGYIEPPVSGEYTLSVTFSDAIRLWLNDSLVIDKWERNSERTEQFSYMMSAREKYAVKLEYYVNRDDEICKLSWEIPGSAYKDIFSKDIRAAKENDCVIAVLGISEATEREGLDRKTIGLPIDQLEYLKSIYAVNNNVVVVLVAGSPLAINWIDAHIPAVINAWYPGESGGSAVADVLFGNYNPAGRLPFTFYKSVDDLPAFNDYNIFNGRTYMYFEGDVLYPFGHGLSYTSFQYDDISIEVFENRVSVSAQIKNTGKFAGDEVIQLYYRDIQSSVKRPKIKLTGFKRVALERDALSTITFDVPFEELKFWDDETDTWKFENGEFEFLLGASSQDIRLSKTVFLEAND